eukprot:8648159-Prorocentrum_lima.AAC.1
MYFKCFFLGACACRCIKPTKGAMSARLIKSQAKAPSRLLYRSCIEGSQLSSGLRSPACRVSISDSSKT